MWPSRIAAVALAGSLAGCGTFVPDFGEFYDTVPPSKLIDAIVSHVHCEVKSQVQFIILDDYELASQIHPGTGKKLGRRLNWLDDWAAQVTLTLTVNEKTTLSPGVTLNTILPNAVTTFPNGNVTSPQSVNVSFGVGGSADATRKAVVSWYIDFRDFTKDKAKLAQARLVRDRLYAEARAAGSPVIASLCNDRNGVLIEGDIKFREWLYMMVTPAFVQDGVTGDFVQNLKNEIKVGKKDVLQDQITFVMQYNGNVTPSWKLLRVSANPSGTFFNAQRTRTQDLVITLGPAPNDVKAAAVQKAQNEALASAIGIAVANALRGGQP
jgi:hypothetical protein